MAGDMLLRIRRAVAAFSRDALDAEEKTLVKAPVTAIVFLGLSSLVHADVFAVKDLLVTSCKGGT
jgi:hypothetical protein